MRKKLFCVVFAIILLLTACTDEPDPVRKGKTRKVPENNRNHSEEVTPTSDADSDEIVIRMWCTAGEYDSMHPAYVQAIEDMQYMYPDIRFEWETFQSDDYRIKIKAAMSAPEANVMPDIFFTFGGHFLEDFVLADRVYCLEDTYEGFSDFLPKNTCRNLIVDGELYGIPTNYNAVLLYSNMDILAKAGYTEVPSTIEEMEDCCDKLLALGNTPFAVGAGPYQGWCIAEYLEPIILQSIGAESVNDILMGRTSWNNPEVAKAVDRLSGMMQKGYFGSRCLEMDNDEAKYGFINGEYAFYMNGSWNCADISLSSDSAINVKVSSFPVINQDKGSPNAFIGGPTDGLAVYKGSPNAEVAAHYAFELSRRISQYAYLYGCGFPAFSMNCENENINGLTRQAARILSGAEFVPYADTVMYTELTDIYYRILPDIMTGKLDGAGFVEYIQKYERQIP
ncbi:MAG: extracellular solute-binding protein [Lachnospiraceae bacterium]|nr:extracellular solute-binding protein [Lachnospiraceae bacterium]